MRRWTLDRCPDCSDSEMTHPLDPPVDVVEASAMRSAWLRGWASGCLGTGIVAALFFWLVVE